MKKIIWLLISVLSVVMFSGCERDATVVSKNLSYDANSFKIKRRIVFINGITDAYLFEIIGYCSIHKDNNDNQLEVTCQVADGQYKKHYLGISDNVTYFVEQLHSQNVDKYHYIVIFKPSVILPDIQSSGE